MLSCKSKDETLFWHSAFSQYIKANCIIIKRTACACAYIWESTATILLRWNQAACFIVKAYLLIRTNYVLDTISLHCWFCCASMHRKLYKWFLWCWSNWMLVASKVLLITRITLRAAMNMVRAAHCLKTENKNEWASESGFISSREKRQLHTEYSGRGGGFIRRW